jgi:putative ABC transport system permease protein
VSEKFCEQAGLSVGDTLTLDNGDGLTADFPITGIVENYVENYIYMTPNAYRQAYGKEPVYDAVLAVLPDGVDEAPESLTAPLLELSGVSGLNQLSTTRASLDDTIASINYVVYVIILCAAMLAFVVLYNLTNINITERTKEIATIKVLGFYEREVQAYVFRESNILAVIGMLVGLVAGIFLHMFIMRTVEVDLVMFGRSIKPLSFVLSAVLTLLFSQIVDLFMRRKLRHISMVESMKAPE